MLRSGASFRPRSQGRLAARGTLYFVQNLVLLAAAAAVIALFVAGTVWLCGLTLLATLGVGTRDRLGAGAGLLWADMWRRFSLVASICVGAVLLSGLWFTWMSWRSFPSSPPARGESGDAKAVSSGRLFGAEQPWPSP